MGKTKPKDNVFGKNFEEAKPLVEVLKEEVPIAEVVIEAPKPAPKPKPKPATKKAIKKKAFKKRR